MWTRREMKNRDPFSGVVELKAKKNKKNFFPFFAHAAENFCFFFKVCLVIEV